MRGKTVIITGAHKRSIEDHFDYPFELEKRLREQWGMKPDDWYVCLHTRDAAHYFEFQGTGQTHRNAPIETAACFMTGPGW